MKKTVALGLVLLLTLSLTACSRSKGNAGTNSGAASTNNHASTPPVTATAPQGGESEVQVLIYDVDDVRVYYLGYADEPHYGPQVKLYVENDKNLEVSVYARDFSVNGIMFTVGSDTRVPPGGTARDSIYIVDTNFGASGITSVEKVEFSLDVINAKEKYRNNSDVISIDIKDPESSGAQPGAAPAGSEPEIKELIYETEEINIYYTGFGFSPASDLQVDFWIENNTSHLIEVSVNRFSLNGVDVLPPMNERVAANKASKGELFVLKPDLDRIGTAGSYQLQFKFKISFTDERRTDVSDFITLDLTE